MNHAQLIVLGRSLRLAGEHGQRLEGKDAVLNADEVRQDLERALALLDEAVTTPKAVTRCREHPNGPVDPDATDLCLLCESRRRGGLRAQRPRPVDERDTEDEGRPVRVQSQHSIRADQPEPKKRWIPEMWNGQDWQVCGRPRQSEQEAEQYLAQLRHRPDAASAYRLVYAFTDHDILRVWGKPVFSTLAPGDL